MHGAFGQKKEDRSPLVLGFVLSIRYIVKLCYKCSTGNLTLYLVAEHRVSIRYGSERSALYQRLLNCKAHMIAPHVGLAYGYHLSWSISNAIHTMISATRTTDKTMSNVSISISFGIRKGAEAPR